MRLQKLPSLNMYSERELIFYAKDGLERTRFHDLRHTYASQLLAEKVHMKVVQAQLGHSDIKVTMNRYSHLTEGMQQEAASKLDEKFKQLHIIKEAA